jgi:arylsulfatase A-like enzyme
MLRQKGYTTAYFDNWHIGLTFFDKEGKPINENGLEGVKRIDYSRSIPDSPIHRGFDRFFGTACCPTTDWLYAYIDGDRIPGSTTGQMTSLTDIMATCAAIIGAELPNEAAEDSYNMLSVLLGRQLNEPVRQYLIQQTISLALSIRRGRWKYLVPFPVSEFCISHIL